MLIARGSLITVEARGTHLMGDGRVVAAAPLLSIYIAEALDETTVLTGEGAFALGICSLLGDEHGVLRATEEVVLHKDARAHSSTHTILCTAVVVVVPHMDGHGAHARVTGVAVVKPVVVIADIVGARLALHSTERRLAAVPEVVVGDGDIL